jgi:transposase-like protein
VEEVKEKKKFKKYEMGYFHLDISTVQTAQGKLYMFVAIDRTSKFAFAKLYEYMTQKEAELFLRELLDFVPYKINKILTDNGIQFTNRSDVETLFEQLCKEEEIEHRRTQNILGGQVERMNRTLKEATVKTFYYETHEQLRSHLRDYLEAYNCAKRLKSLEGKTPCQFIQERLKKKPELAHQYTTKLDN